MLRGVLIRIGFIAGVLALLVGSVPATLTLAQDTTTFAATDEMRLQALSPDGTVIATTDNGARTLCVHSVPEGEPVTCIELRTDELDVTLDPASISWSPASDALVFAERSAQFLVDSDIWHLDIASGDLTNLTDDGVGGGLPIISSEDDTADFLVDLVPAWSPDGGTIAFSRFTYGADDPIPTSVMLIDVASGEVSELTVFAEEQSFGLPYNLAWSPSGNVIFGTGYSPDPGDDINGVWAIDTQSGESTKLAGANPDFLGATASLAAVSPAGSHLVISYPSLLWGTREADTPSGYALLDLVSGEITPIEPSDIYAGDYSAAVGPTFSPDGSALIFGVRQPTADAGFVIARDIESGDETVLAEFDGPPFLFVSEPLESLQVGGGSVLALIDFSTAVIAELPADITDAPELPGADSIPVATPDADETDEPIASPEAIDQATPDPDEEITEPVDTVMTIAGNSAVLREGPSREDDIIAILSPGTELTPISEAFESDDHFWIEVEVIETGETGFVRTDFLEAVG